MTNVSRNLVESAVKYPDTTALACDDTTKSYASLAKDVACFADYLIDCGLQPDDRVGVILPNGPEFAVAFYGVLHAGGVVAPLSPALAARAVEFCLSITHARMVVVTPRHAIADMVAAVTAGTQPVRIGGHRIAPLTAGFAGSTELVSKAANDAAVVLPLAEAPGAHTVELTHGELAGSQAAIRERSFPLGHDDVVMGCLPMSERMGMTCGLLAAVSNGSTLVVPSCDPSVDPATALETLAAKRITVFEGAPAMYAAMLDASQHYDEDFSSLRVCVMTGGSLPAGVVRRFEDRFGCVVVHADK